MNKPTRTERIAAAAAILQPQLAATPHPSGEQILAAARAVGLDLPNRWHYDRIVAQARLLDAQAILAELRGTR